MSFDIKQLLPLLKELQEIDRCLQQTDREIQKIPETLESSGAEYLTLDRNLQEKEALLKAKNGERQGLENDLKNDLQKAEDREKRLYAIKTQKEYQATLKEIALLKKTNKERENRILVLLEEGEKISAEITQLKPRLTDKEGAYRQMEKELKEREGELQREREASGKRRPALLEEIPSEILKKYEFVRRTYTEALAAVVRGICQGCHMNIPPQFYNEMLKGTDLRNCPHCRRLIYAEIAEAKEVSERE